jgi:hypothetical protein
MRHVPKRASQARPGIWLFTHEGLRKRYDAIQEVLADRLADTCQMIARDEKDNIPWAKHYCDVLRWRVGKLNPRKYGSATS